jgi:hypothetical protein
MSYEQRIDYPLVITDIAATIIAVYVTDRTPSR